MLFKRAHAPSRIDCDAIAAIFSANKFRNGAPGGPALPLAVKGAGSNFKIMHENTEFTLSRACEVILIPSGQKFTIPAETKGVITQTLGGSYTIATSYGLSRVAEKDIDALGIEKTEEQTQSKSPAAKTNGEVAEEDVWNQLRQCYDPEIPVNIVDLGLVYDCRLTKKDDGGTKVEVKMTLTAPGCGMGPAIAHDAQSKILTIDGVDEADVQLVWDPPWNQDMISEAGRMKLGMI